MSGGSFGPGTPSPEDVAEIIARVATQHFIFNALKPPFDDVRVRKAVSATLDRVALASILNEAGWERQRSRQAVWYRR